MQENYPTCTMEQWQKERQEDCPTPAVCAAYSIERSCLCFLTSFCSRVVFLHIFIHSLFLNFFTSPSLLEMLFCRYRPLVYRT